MGIYSGIRDGEVHTGMRSDVIIPVNAAKYFFLFLASRILFS